MGLLCLFDQDRRSGAPRAAVGESGRGVGQHYPDFSRRLYPASTKTHLAPAIHYGHGPVQTEDHRAWRLALSGDGFRRLGGLLLDVVPLLSVVGGSFMTRFGFFNLPKTWTLEYWKMALSDPRILQGLQNTLIVAVSAGLVGALFFSLIGYVLVRTKLPGRGDAGFDLLVAVGDSRRALRVWVCCGCFSARRSFGPFTARIVLLVVAQVLGGITSGDPNSQGEFRSVGQGARRVVAHVRRGLLAHLFAHRVSAHGADHGDGRA